jgi:type VI secretion system protein VasD
VPPWRAALQRDLCRLLVLLGGGLVAGCGSLPDGRSGVLDQALSVIGLQRSAPAGGLTGLPNVMTSSASVVTKRVLVRVHAGHVLNLGATGRSLPLVLRLYKLRDRTAFDQMPYAAFSRSSGADSMNFSADVVETRELVFIPGQRYEVVENLEPNVQYFAVVALFRAPVEQRWRVIFDAKSAATTGITLGLHGCAISVSAGQAPEIPVELMRVAGVRCDGGSG